MPDDDLPSAAPSGGPTPPALLHALVTAPVIRTYVVDRDLRILRTGTLTFGEPPERVAGRLLTEVFRLEDPAAPARVLRRNLPGVPETPGPPASATPPPAGPALPEHATPSGDDGSGPAAVVRAHRTDTAGTDRTFAVALHPLASDAGTGGPPDASGPGPAGLLVLAADITAQERTVARAAALDAVRERVGQSLDLAATCQELVVALVPGFADIAVVEIVDDVLRGADTPTGPPARGTPLRRIAFRGPLGKGGAAHPVGDVREMPHPTPYSLSLGDLRPRLVQLAPGLPWYTTDPDRAASIEKFGSHSLIVAPLALRGTALGVVSFYRCGGSAPYDESDLAFGVTLAAHTALSVDNARRYERDHTVASTVQRRLLPPGPTSPVALETAHVYLPGRNSGSWFDTISLSGARTALVVGRVDGQGVQTASTMGQLRTAVRTLAALDLSPEELLARLNDVAVQLAEERAALPVGDTLRHRPLTATCLYGEYDPFTRLWTVARAGRPVPRIVRPDGTAQPFDLPEGPTLAAAEGAPFVTTEIALEPGTLLVLHSGGNLHDRPGRRSVDEVLSPPDRSLREIGDAIVYNYPPAAHPDGAVLLLARPAEAGPAQVATVALEDDAGAPAKARTATRAHLAAWKIPKDALYAVELIVSELVTNAVRYGTPPLVLRLVRTHTVTCEVRDASLVAPHLRHARAGDEGGRGLFIMSQLASRWGTRYSHDAKIIWAEVEL
ncbi:SpoIIE family protein phosphatase [Streptomyces sp. NBC_01218]|uniref:SpoIIE family protein phosphatase n=1 Tax=unclassified Streptomyces TaxID=2593676 RepID=UPI0023B95167|nr:MULTISPECIES: SpoIIE family protein phosphatase [unclassified Streptomyces]WEH39561.1 SpoIIE family protein phosphatase [Streptomyces sp. AM 2-1-1]WSQ51254.1 SpoIIE family protein phosphatase [Streptomyces sp. NBC_01218]